MQSKRLFSRSLVRNGNMMPSSHRCNSLSFTLSKITRIYHQSDHDGIFSLSFDSTRTIMDCDTVVVVLRCAHSTISSSSTIPRWYTSTNTHNYCGNDDDRNDNRIRDGRIPDIATTCTPFSQCIHSVHGVWVHG